MIVLLAGALMAGGACKVSPPKPAPSRPAGSAGIGLRIAPSKALYRSGEPIVLSLLLTNRTAESCHLSRVAAGAVTILSLTRDGTAITPVLSTGSYLDGFASFLAANLVAVAPGASQTVSLASELNPATGGRAALRTASLGSNDQAALAFWPVDQVGHYTLTASYLLPPLPRAPIDRCGVSANTVSVSFSVASR